MISPPQFIYDCTFSRDFSSILRFLLLLIALATSVDSFYLRSRLAIELTNEFKRQIIWFIKKKFYEAPSFHFGILDINNRKN